MTLGPAQLDPADRLEEFRWLAAGHTPLDTAARRLGYTLHGIARLLERHGRADATDTELLSRVRAMVSQEENK